MRKRDCILIFIYIFLGIVGIIYTIAMRGKGDAYIYVSGRIVGRYDLSTDTDIRIEGEGGIINDIAIEDGCVYMKNATCPYKECVKCGKISHSGESIVCLPAKVMIVIIDDGQNGYDAITK